MTSAKTYRALAERWATTVGDRQTRELMVQAAISVFAADNPRFNAKRFWRACGLDGKDLPDLLQAQINIGKEERKANNG